MLDKFVVGVKVDNFGFSKTETGAITGVAIFVATVDNVVVATTGKTTLETGEGDARTGKTGAGNATTVETGLKAFDKAADTTVGICAGVTIEVDTILEAFDKVDAAIDAFACKICGSFKFAA